MTANIDPNIMVIALMIIALLAIAMWLHFRRHASQTLERRFGPEYGRTVEEFGSRAKAEAELKARQQRVERFHIVPLAAQEASHFSESWRSLQARFVDNPKGVLADADRLVGELMEKRGYPMGDFETRAADISVHHPSVVEHYRAAHETALQDQRGEVDTEGMRQAVIHYRALFAELLEVEPKPMREGKLETQS